MPKLIIKKDDLLLKKVSVPKEILAFTVGAEQGNDIIIEDKSVSFFHLQFEKQNEQYYVRDLQSQWGTFVNGRKITNRALVNNNDEIGVGTHNITFLLPEKENEPSFVAESYELEQFSSEHPIEDRISGLPKLTNLNSWIHEETETFRKKGDFFIENNNKPAEVEDAIKFPTNDSSFDASKNNNNSNHNCPFDFVDKKVSDYQEPIVNLETDSILQQKQSKTPKIEFDESIPLIEDFEQQPKSEKENYYLLGIYGYYLGRMFKIKHPETKIGRDKKLNDIVIKKNSKGKIDQSVSRRQATITYKNNKYYITDKRSKSRTYVNQNKLDIDEEIQINPGDEIEIVSERKSHILRMVEKENWDFSFPKKAGTWYIRHRIKTLNILSVIFIALASIILVSSFISKNKITQQPNPLTVNETVWYAEDIAAKSINDEPSQFISYPAIADFDGDKIIDLIYIGPDGFLKCIDGRSHQPLWINHDFEAMANIPLTIEDLNQNAKPDVIVVSKDLRVRVIDGTWGIEIWKSPILAGPLTGPPIVGDFDGDGLKDIAIASREKVVYIGYSSVKNTRWLKVNMQAPTRAIASTADLTDDGILNILIGTETGKIVEIDGFLQRTEEKLDINEELNKAIGSFYQDNKIRYPVALGDLNGDTIQDLIVGSVQGNLIAVNGATLERLWYDTFRVNADKESTFNHSIALGDLDGDKLLDIIALTPDGNLRAFKGRGQGKDRKMVLWESPKTENRPFVGSPVLADFNKNGTQDVVIANNAGNIYIFEGATGEILWKSNSGGSPLIGTPVIGDLDNDHRLDILALKADGNFYKLLTNSLISDNALVWGQMFGNSRHTNSSLYQVPDVSSYSVYILIAVMVNLIIIALHFVFRQKRKKLSQILVTP